jgi:hypothetical protein
MTIGDYEAARLDNGVTGSSVSGIRPQPGVRGRHAQIRFGTAEVIVRLRGAGRTRHARHCEAD